MVAVRASCHMLTRGVDVTCTVFIKGYLTDGTVFLDSTKEEMDFVLGRGSDHLRTSFSLWEAN